MRVCVHDECEHGQQEETTYPLGAQQRYNTHGPGGKKENRGDVSAFLTFSVSARIAYTNIFTYIYMSIAKKQ